MEKRKIFWCEICSGQFSASNRAKHLRDMHGLSSVGKGRKIKFPDPNGHLEPPRKEYFPDGKKTPEIVKLPIVPPLSTINGPSGNASGSLPASSLPATLTSFFGPNKEVKALMGSTPVPAEEAKKGSTNQQASMPASDQIVLDTTTASRTEKKNRLPCICCFTFSKYSRSIVV